MTSSKKKRQGHFIMVAAALVTLGMLIFLALFFLEEEEVSGIEAVEILESGAKFEGAKIPKRNSIDKELHGAVSSVPKTEVENPKHALVKKETRKPLLTRSEKQPLLVDSFGSIKIHVSLDKKLLREISRKKMNIKFKVRIEPTRGLDPAFHSREAVVDHVNLSATFAEVAAVTWRVLIAGVMVGEVVVEPNEEAHFGFTSRRLRTRLDIVDVLVLDQSGKPVQGAEITWIPTERRSLVHEGIFVGRTDVAGSLRAFASRRGAFLARHGDSAPVLCLKNKPLARSHGLISRNPRVATLKKDSVLTSVSGRVLHFETRQPIKGAFVEVLAGKDIYRRRFGWEKAMRKFRKACAKKKLVSYPSEFGVHAYSQSTGKFRVTMVSPGPNMILVRHPDLESPQPIYLDVDEEGAIDILVDMKPGASAKGRLDQGPRTWSLAVDPIYYVGSFEKSIYRPTVARDGSYHAHGFRVWEFTLGVATNPWANNFLQLRNVTPAKGKRQIRQDFHVD